jgi:hypothetical protein
MKWYHYLLMIPLVGLIVWVIVSRKYPTGRIEVINNLSGPPVDPNPADVVIAFTIADQPVALIKKTD